MHHVDQHEKLKEGYLKAKLAMGSNYRCVLLDLDSFKFWLNQEVLGAGQKLWCPLLKNVVCPQVGMIQVLWLCPRGLSKILGLLPQCFIAGALPDVAGYVTIPGSPEIRL